VILFATRELLMPKPKPKFTKSTPLSAIYFGKDDAESDFGTGGLLQQGFLRTMAYEEALAGRKTLFVGRKGSGKSAICLVLHGALSKDNRVALITPDEISAEEIRRFALAGISPESSKELIWRYVFAVQIAKFLLLRAKEHKKDVAIHKYVNSIRRFLIDNNEIEDLSVASRFWKTVEQLKGKLSFEAFSVKVDMEADIHSNHPSPGTFATEQLDRLELHLKLVGESLKISPKTSRLWLLVDQVEKIWSNDPESNSMVIGLLLAAKKVGVAFPFVQCTVFLRTDIYENVRFQEGDKYRTDEFRLAWDKNSLLELALTRAKASSSIKLTEEDLWRHVFPSNVDSNKLPDFLIDMTLMRPRDIIQLCNSCRYTAQANGHSSILPEDVKQAVKTFSTWKLNDIQNE
jgi:energy-coupling factor transporter ATP-binding protein EcfA2